MSKQQSPRQHPPEQHPPEQHQDRPWPADVRELVVEHSRHLRDELTEGPSPTASLTAFGDAALAGRADALLEALAAHVVPAAEHEKSLRVLAGHQGANKDLAATARRWRERYERAIAGTEAEALRRAILDHTQTKEVREKSPAAGQLRAFVGGDR